MTRPAMTGEVASPVLPGDWIPDPAACTLAYRRSADVLRHKELHMFTQLDRRPGRPDHGPAETGQTGPPGRRATGLVTRFGSLPFRQLAGPTGVFFLWPPKSLARTSTSPGAQP
jgi:hypothetical protein